ncbi:ATP12 family chaperone protein [Palleronia pelagia]|uniref:Chaperone required for the assembly of the F1-ATPase n=1 Tax=Palleronia pelagia TaxID=387096 RepID=A0A1H8DZF8_9RHOB|nr:ATP12 family protein [Palleronia pelagia]SEN11927.1 Chaperone required for the assembly of the F1-ATPase [Palleronia pelagia]
MSEWSPKRFWKQTTVGQEGDGFTVLLDDKPIRTPAKAALALPTKAMAEAVATEWDAQGERIVPDSMPVTRSANSAIDKVTVQKPEVVAMLAEYGATDLLSYRADGPEELVERQAAAWDPYLDWAADRFDARLAVTGGVMPVAQDSTALDRLAAPLGELDAFELTAAHDLIAMSGSLVLGLAVIEGRAAAAPIWDISRVDELWQAEVWGRDEEAEETAARKRGDFLHAERFLQLARNA